MARSFSGSGRVNCPNLAFPNDTVSGYCWAKGPGTGNDSMIDVSNRLTWWFDSSDGLVLSTSSGAQSGQWTLANASLGVTVSDWNWYGFTYDATSGSNDPIFYINGQQASAPTEDDAPGSFLNTAAAMYLGNFGSGTGPFEGSIAHCALHSVVLTPEEMQTAYRQGAVWRELLRYYTLDGEATEPDYSGNVQNSSSITATSTITDGPPTMGPWYMPSAVYKALASGDLTLALAAAATATFQGNTHSLAQVSSPSVGTVTFQGNTHTLLQSLALAAAAVVSFAGKVVSYTGVDGTSIVGSLLHLWRRRRRF